MDYLEALKMGAIKNGDKITIETKDGKFFDTIACKNGYILSEGLNIKVSKEHGFKIYKINDTIILELD